MRTTVNIYVLALYIIQTSAESTEDTFPSHMYNPAHVNFNEIFTNSLAMLTDDAITTIVKDDDFHLSSLPSQFTEFRPITDSSTTSTTTATPSPRYLKPRYTEKEKRTTTTVKTTSTTPSTTTRTTSTAPLKIQRGVLDLLFPAQRVKGFKHVFDRLRSLLSKTFR